ncbi:class I SAM-dependent methyltransferase [Micromonospora craniellae]|uniref:Class I SAM-dependent methyltransferase n=1 Tax=Micromonospora craniellae TaxID=2294034 RepID=A0A372FRI2_9ACTN|nr:class I SAM-dependent methyltransferase [Micromonospora craniellae]QOC94400.1 class I SAM-dependent methyltransferase [Micromonospora craniellae]RFS43186.1 class I SAM-dependent methyltransferase [Micromonospora craniellae]
MTTTLPTHSSPPQQLLIPCIDTVLDRLDITTNQRVLEIGAGAGEITARLAELVGRYGSVTAVDAETSRLTGTPVVDVQRRDPNRDLLPGQAARYDHIIARWPHGTLHDPADVIEQMIVRLCPGGWLVLADITPTPPRIHRTPDDEAGTLIHAVMQQVHHALTGPHGATWTADPGALLMSHGLAEHCIHTGTETWTGAGPGCRLLADIVTHLRPHLDITDADADRFAHLMTDPRVLLGRYESRVIHARERT